jgi:16S rRNA (cytosine967-C5)-methyltransferase
VTAAAAATARTRAVDALRKVLEHGRPAAPLVTELSRGLAPAEQDLLRELVLGVLRWKAALDSEIAAVSRVRMDRLAPGLGEILEVALYQVRHLDRVPPYAAVNEAVEHARSSGGEGAAKLVNGVLRGILRLPAPAPAEGTPSLARAFSHPEFLVERWVARFGPETARRILEADNAAPLLDLLVNPNRTDRETLRAALSREGTVAEPSPLSPLALTVTSGNPVRSSLLAEGHFSIQDVGSQILPLLLPAGGFLVDLASAPGGKAISALAHGTAREALALDRSRNRLSRVVENARRLQWPTIRPVAASLDAPPLAERRFDRVLLDAPCSGTGTLRKNPEIRYRVSASAIERLAASQELWLAAAAALVAPGGFLLYSTCSLEEEENERVVERVLARTSDLAAEPIQAPDALRPFVDGARFRILPDARSDGFTAHLLRRRG